MIRTAANSPAVLRERLAGTTLNLRRFNYFSKYIYVIEREERPAAKLSGRALIEPERYALPAGWPCRHFAGIARLLRDPWEGPVKALENFFHDVGIADHLLEGRHMKKELREQFGFSLPYDLIVLATEAGRAAVLREFGYRFRPETVTPHDIRYAHLLLNIAGEVYNELVDTLATYAIAWPCQYCRRLILDLEPAYCSSICERSHDRREVYKRQTDGRTRNKCRAPGTPMQRP